MSTHYAAAGGCSSCPFRGRPCHEARQRVQDPLLEVGRHYGCEFYRAISRELRLAPAPARWWRRFLLAAE